MGEIRETSDLSLSGPKTEVYIGEITNLGRAVQGPMYQMMEPFCHRVDCYIQLLNADGTTRVDVRVAD